MRMTVKLSFDEVFSEVIPYGNVPTSSGDPGIRMQRPTYVPKWQGLCLWTTREQLLACLRGESSEPHRQTRSMLDQLLNKKTRKGKIRAEWFCIEDLDAQVQGGYLPIRHVKFYGFVEKSIHSDSQLVCRDESVGSQLGEV